MDTASSIAARHPGELVSAPDYALSFRMLEPAPAPPRRLLLLLHGWDDDERQLAAFGAQVDPATLVVLPRGPRSAGEDRFGWYRVSFDGGEPDAVADEVADSLAKLLEFVGQLRARHDVPAAATVAAGFSQGGALAAAAALTQPGSVAGFGMFGGRLLPEVETRAATELLASMEAFIAHGRDDSTLDVELAQRADRWLRSRGLACELHIHAGGHAPSAAMQRDFAAWFAGAGRAWHG